MERNKEQIEKAMHIPTNMVTTAFEIPGYTIEENMGVVRGISVRSIGFIKGFFAGFRALGEGTISSYVELCELTRQEALALVVQEAHARGANAIIGFRYDTNEIRDQITEVLAYGTAVKVSKR